MLAIPSDKNTFAIFCGISRDTKLQASQMNIPTKSSTSEGSISPGVNQSGLRLATTRMLLMTQGLIVSTFSPSPVVKKLGFSESLPGIATFACYS